MKLDGRVRILEDHDAALEYHEWITTGELVEGLDRLGRRRGRTGRPWQRWSCNSELCPAEALVSTEALEELVTAWLTPPDH